MGIDEAVLTAEQNKLIAQKEAFDQQKKTQAKRFNETPMRLTVPPAHKAAIIAPYTTADTIEAYERESIRMLLNYGTAQLQNDQPLYTYLVQELADVHFRTPAYKMIWELFQERLAQGASIDAAYFIQHDDEMVQKTSIDLTAAPYEISEQWE